MYMFVDLQEKIPMQEVFEQLKCSKDGLSSDEGAKRLEIFGPNKLEEKKARYSIFFFFAISWLLLFLLYSANWWKYKTCMIQESKFLKFLGFMWNPLSWVMEIAAVMAIVLANGGVGIYY